jgi:predicted secreted Zn-dependent protease
VCRTFAAGLACALLAVPLGAAALQKCVGPDGKVSYSDRNCPAGTKKTTVAAEPRGPLSDAEVHYYDVEGRELPALRLSVISRGHGHPGYATWYLSYEFKTKPVAGGCAVDDLVTKLDLKVVMPQWKKPVNAAPGLETHWARFLAALKVHEDGHLQIGRDFEANFRRFARTLKAPKCAEIEPVLRARFRVLQEQARKRDEEYDAKTERGAKQGAVLR